MGDQTLDLRTVLRRRDDRSRHGSVGIERRVRAFAELLAAEDRRAVLEVGCGARRDGTRLLSSGADYTGVDLSSAAD